MYGQDVEVPKVVEIKAEGSTILVNMDLQLGLPASAHVIGDSHVLYTRVVKEGKTKVSIQGPFRTIIKVLYFLTLFQCF